MPHRDRASDGYSTGAPSEDLLRLLDQSPAPKEEPSGFQWLGTTESTEKCGRYYRLVVTADKSPARTPTYCTSWRCRVCAQFKARRALDRLWAMAQKTERLYVVLTKLHDRWEWTRVRKNLTQRSNRRSSEECPHGGVTIRQSGARVYCFALADAGAADTPRALCTPELACQIAWEHAIVPGRTTSMRWFGLWSPPRRRPSGSTFIGVGSEERCEAVAEQAREMLVQTHGNTPAPFEETVDIYKQVWESPE